MKDKILAMLPKLKKADLEAIQATITALLGGHVGAIAQPASPLAAPAYEALSKVLNSTASHARVTGTKAGRLFAKKLPDLTKWLDTNFVGWDSYKIAQLAFLEFLFELLTEDLKRQGLPRNFGIAVANLDRIPKLFEDAFPGYIKSGWSRLILKSFMPS